MPSFLFYFFLPPRNVPEGLSKPPRLLSWIERISQMVCIAILLFAGDAFERAPDIFALIACICFFSYFLLWARYLYMKRDYEGLYRPLVGLPVPMAVLPAVALCAVAAYIQSAALVSFAILFAISHVCVSLYRWWDLKK